MKALKVTERQAAMVTDAIRLILDAAVEASAMSENVDEQDQALVCMAFVLAPWLIVHDLMAGEITRDEAEEINQLASGVAAGLEQWMGAKWDEIMAPRH